MTAVAIKPVIRGAPESGRVPDSALARLARIPADRHWIVSCYYPLALGALNRRANLRSLRTRLQSAVRDLSRGSIPSGARPGVDEDLRRVGQYLGDPANLPGGGGLALFACHELGLFEIVPLSRVHRVRVVVDRSPRVREMVELDAESGVVYTVVADRGHARFFEVTSMGATEVACLGSPMSVAGKFHRDRQGAPGWGEWHYQNRIERERERHYEALVRHLRMLDAQRHARGFVVAAPGPEATVIARFMDHDLAQRLLGTARLTPKTASLDEVFALTAHVRAAHEREVAREEIEKRRDALGEGWAVNGIEPSLKALHLGKVRTLLVAGHLETPGFRCATGRLTIDDELCRAEGLARIVPDVMDEAIEDALRQRARVMVIEDSEGADVDGLAAVLRFR